ncbi:hypothetical protein TNCV_1553341 [Trichonephila clavipes]|nr:hypothetical protein TNCV_1553341 [Trichonephila clavipes]
MKEERFVLGTFRSERMRVLYRSREDDRLRMMFVLVHIDITPPHRPCLGSSRFYSFHMPLPCLRKLYLLRSLMHSFTLYTDAVFVKDRESFVFGYRLRINY